MSDRDGPTTQLFEAELDVVRDQVTDAAQVVGGGGERGQPARVARRREAIRPGRPAPVRRGPGRLLRRGGAGAAEPRPAGQGVGAIHRRKEEEIALDAVARIVLGIDLLRPVAHAGEVDLEVRVEGQREGQELADDERVGLGPGTDVGGVVEGADLDGQ